MAHADSLELSSLAALCSSDQLSCSVAGIFAFQPVDHGWNVMLEQSVTYQ